MANMQEPESSRTNERGIEGLDARGVEFKGEQDGKTDTERETEENMVYDEMELRPGGTGKQGDQQQMGQDREPRRDKSKNSGDSDKMHEE